MHDDSLPHTQVRVMGYAEELYVLILYVFSCGRSALFRQQLQQDRDMLCAVCCDTPCLLRRAIGRGLLCTDATTSITLLNTSAVQ